MPADSEHIHSARQSQVCLDQGIRHGEDRGLSTGVNVVLNLVSRVGKNHIARAENSGKVFKQSLNVCR